MNLQAMQDHLALQALVIDYAHAIDTRDFAALDALFTPQAYIDYRAMGGIDGPYPQIRSWLQTALAAFPGYMHLTGNARFRIDGDTATGVVACFNPMLLPASLAEHPGHTMFLGLWYHDTYQRHADGWRISRRVETRSFASQVPLAMQALLAQPQA